MYFVGTLIKKNKREDEGASLQQDLVVDIVGYIFVGQHNAGSYNDFRRNVHSSAWSSGH